MKAKIEFASPFPSIFTTNAATKEHICGECFFYAGHNCVREFLLGVHEQKKFGTAVVEDQYVSLHVCHISKSLKDKNMVKLKDYCIT
jgi:hypothetical protein